MRAFTGIALLALSSIASAYDPDFVCLGDDKKEILFLNRDTDTIVPDLYQVRVMMGGYPGQYALNYAGYIFMREKLGINVTWFPTSDFDTYWSYYDMATHGCSYPNCYWHWLEQDNIDVNFEFWPIQARVTDAQKYYSAGTAIPGFVGNYGEMSWYVPKYFSDAYPEVLLPNYIKNDQTLRELLINGSINGGNTSWIEKFSAANRTFTTIYDVPNGSRPVVWGSVESYLMSVYSYGLKNTLLGGLDVDFVTAGSEGGLTDIVTDLYLNRVPFIANAYVPDNNFALIDPTTGDFFEYDRIAFPRNPDQSQDDECALAFECQFAIEPLGKLANQHLQERFPEAYTFFQGFGMPSSQVALIISKYITVNSQPGSASMTEHEKWLNASCEWLKDPKSFSTWNVSAWMVDIDRYDCIPGCGIENINGDYVGGTCDYTTATEDGDGTCICNHDELYGDLCDQSCPGLKGPIQNESDSSEWYFEWCNGHGSCDTVTYQCTCEKGWGDRGCTTKYDQYVFPVAVAGVIMAFSCILAIVCILCIVWLRMNAQYKTVKALSIDLTTIFTSGLVFLIISNVPEVIEWSDASCCAWQWLFGMGGILSIMSPLLKAYRVSRVFHGGKMLRAVKITDKMLMNMLLKAAGLEVVICIGYTIVHQMFGGVETNYNDDELRKETVCNQSVATTYVSLASYAYFFIMLCALTYYSYGTRRALSVFKESTCAYSSSFLSLFCTLITFVFYLATNDPAFRVAVQSSAIIIVVSAVLGLFYGTRIYTFFTEPENRNVTDMKSPSYTSSSTTGALTQPPAPPPAANA